MYMYVDVCIYVYSAGHLNAEVAPVRALKCGIYTRRPYDVERGVCECANVGGVGVISYVHAYVLRP